MFAEDENFYYNTYTTKIIQVKELRSKESEKVQVKVSKVSENSQVNPMWQWTEWYWLSLTEKTT